MTILTVPSGPVPERSATAPTRPRIRVIDALASWLVISRAELSPVLQVAGDQLLAALPELIGRGDIRRLDPVAIHWLQTELVGTPASTRRQRAVLALFLTWCRQHDLLS